MKTLVIAALLLASLTAVCTPEDPEDFEEGLRRINEEHATAAAEWDDHLTYRPREVHCDVSPPRWVCKDAREVLDANLNEVKGTPHNFRSALIFECAPSRQDGMWRLTGTWREGPDFPPPPGPITLPTEEELKQVCDVLPPVAP